MSDRKNLARVVRFNANKYLGKLLPHIYTFNRYSNAVSNHHAFVQRITEGTRVVVAARFHGVCFCMKLGVPFLAIASNTPKIEGMLADAGLSDRMLDIGDLDIATIERRASWTSAHEDRRLRYIAHAKERISAMFDDISEMLH
jgi:polysaccharide pyruvyl transferase WcaK-like protein